MAINEFASIITNVFKIVIINNKTFKDAAALTKGFIIKFISIKYNHFSNTREQKYNYNSRRGRKVVEIKCGNKRDYV